MERRKPMIRVIPSRELAECPAMRLDAEHYIPRHRRWECRKGSRLRSRGSFSQGMAGRRDKLRGFARGHESRLRMDENPSISPSSENRFVEVCGADLEEGVKK